MSDPTRSPGDDVRAFDLIIVGAGSGNSLIGPEHTGWRIALIDDGEWFGGTCLNAGCIPTKMFVRPADILAEAREAGRLGVTAGSAGVDWPAVRDRVFGRTDAISTAGLRYRRDESAGVTLYRESVRFLDAHTLVTATGQRIRADRIVVAAGSRPRALDAPHPDDAAIHDSDTIMRVDRLPESLIILGGGAVAVEFAHIFSALGVRVTVVTRSDRLLRAWDDDIAELMTRRVAEYASHVVGAVTDIERDGAGLVVRLDSGRTVTGDALLVAQGRVPNTDRLDAGRAGFDLEADGRLAVDSAQRVLAGGEPVPGVFALGDIDDAHQLKHVANHEARLVAHNVTHPDDLHRGEPGPVPAAVFGHPQVAAFGPTEREAAEAGLDVVVVRQDYGSTAYGWALEDTTSFCKLVVERPGGRLLGAHVAGPEASILIQPLVMAASLGHGVPGLARAQYWPHPAASEVVENALLSAEERLADPRGAAS